MRPLFIAWQDRENRQWYPVGRLTSAGGMYEFCYTKGASTAKNFIPFGRMSDLNSIYKSEHLFPLFANRILSSNRPEFNDFLRWLNLDAERPDPFAILSLTGGQRGTDNLEVFECPQRTDDNKYVTNFFDHGLSHMPKPAVEVANNLNPGERLYLMHDLQNPFDQWALALRTDKTSTIIGYCPRYFTKDFHLLLQSCPEEVIVTVEKVNLDAPLQLRVLCRLEAPWRDEFLPCADEAYQPISQSGVACFCS